MKPARNPLTRRTFREKKVHNLTFVYASDENRKQKTEKKKKRKTNKNIIDGSI